MFFFYPLIKSLLIEENDSNSSVTQPSREDSILIESLFFFTSERQFQIHFQSNSLNFSRTMHFFHVRGRRQLPELHRLRKRNKTEIIQRPNKKYFIHRFRIFIFLTLFNSIPQDTVILVMNVDFFDSCCYLDAISNRVSTSYSKTKVIFSWIIENKIMKKKYFFSL